ncbi:hypothetical protein BH10PAT3_BH10PAT3_5170 [soil metagenome]
MEIRKKRIIGGAAGAAAGLLIGLGAARMMHEIDTSAAEPCASPVGNVALNHNVTVENCSSAHAPQESKTGRPTPPELPSGLIVSFVTLVGMGIGTSLPEGEPKSKLAGEQQHMQAA